MVTRGVWSVGPGARPHRRTLLLGLLLVALVVPVLTLRLAERAGADPDRCERFAADSADRAAAVTGSGDRVVVIGDSWAAGLGLDETARSWPSRLRGAVHVAAFSGSGFSAHASDCGRVGYAERASAALRGGADLVVVEGGLNDYDQPTAEIRAGFARLMRVLAGETVVVVGPASAPARADAVPRVDGLLARLSARYDVSYVRTSGLDLPYLGDGLHLTPTGHRQFGDYVAAELERPQLR